MLVGGSIAKAKAWAGLIPSPSVFIFIPGTGSWPTDLLDLTAKELKNGLLPRFHREHTWICLDVTSVTGGWKAAAPNWVHQFVADIVAQAQSRDIDVSLVGFSRGAYWAAQVVPTMPLNLKLKKVVLVAVYWMGEMDAQAAALSLAAADGGVELISAVSMTDACCLWSVHGQAIMQLARPPHTLLLYSARSHEAMRESWIVGTAEDPNASQIMVDFLYRDLQVRYTPPVGPRVHWYIDGALVQPGP